MLKRIFTYPYNRFKHLYSKQIDDLGLEIFRVFFFACLLGDVCVLLKYNHLIFDRIPYIQAYELSLWPALVLWILALFAIIIGYKTRFALLANYLFCIVFIANVST